jgi:hypothetical protein
MLQQRKPDIKWYSPGGLEDMFFCLYQCDREGEDPEDHVREHRVPLVRAILADLRLKGCFGYVSLEKTENMPYSELRYRAIFLKEQILKWMDGRIYDRRDLRKPRRGAKRHAKITPRKKLPPRPLCGISKEELKRMESKLASFLEYGEDPPDVRQQALQILCYDVDAIVSDDRFRKFAWHAIPNTLHYSALYQSVEEAKKTISFMLKILESHGDEE